MNTTPPKQAVATGLRVLLVLGRVSNLPTVWSNCLAAWWLGGGGAPARFGQLAAGATLLYTGGMFLNDACDQDFDRRHRPERPIPAGQIKGQTVRACAAVLLAAGWLLLLPLEKAAWPASLLLAAIVIYDAVHKQTALAPILMATCRFLLYLVAASAAIRGVHAEVIWRALALAAYVCGLSWLARGESDKPSGATARWPIGLLLAPLLLALMIGANTWPASLMPLVGAGTWIFWCLRGRAAGAHWDLSRAVPGLLAGMVLIDWLAVGAGHAAFAVLFTLALVLQRIVPAT